MSTVGLFGACAPPPPPPYSVIIHVDSDPGLALPGAVISRNAKDLAITGPDGNAMITMTGNDGETSDFAIRCPVDFTSPTAPLSVTIRRLSSTGKAPEYTASCPPNVRHVVVAVRADGGPNLPIIYLGKAVGKTDSAGAAHLLLAMRPGDQFELALDTSAIERLQPPSPHRVFVVKDADDMQEFEQKFALRPLPPKRKVVIKKPTQIKPKSGDFD
ncbi:MAG: hypothetical protein ABI551_17610 [Polyangiaceae bacterium]